MTKNTASVYLILTLCLFLDLSLDFSFTYYFQFKTQFQGESIKPTKDLNCLERLSQDDTLMLWKQTTANRWTAVKPFGTVWSNTWFPSSFSPSHSTSQSSWKQKLSIVRLTHLISLSLTRQLQVMTRIYSYTSNCKRFDCKGFYYIKNVKEKLNFITNI